MKPGAPPLQSIRLLDQVRERIRYLHYSLKTEKAYLYWTRFFIRWSATQPGGMRHPRDMGAKEVEAFLSMMTNERKASASTHNRALSAVLFLYREVLNIDLPWRNNIGRPQQAKRIPAVLTKEEIARLFSPAICRVGRHARSARTAALWHRHAAHGGDASAHQRRGF